MTRIQLLHDEIKTPIKDTKHIFSFIEDKKFFHKPSVEQKVGYLNSVKEVLEGINRSIEMYIFAKDLTETKPKRPRTKRLLKDKPIEDLEQLEILCGILTDPIKRPSQDYCTAGPGTNVYKKGDNFIIYFVPSKRFDHPFRVEYPRTNVDFLKKVNFNAVEFN